MTAKLLLALRVMRSAGIEFKIVLATLAVILLLPVMGVVVIATAPLQIVSGALAAVNPVTHQVEVRNAKGEIVVRLDATTTWPVHGYVSEEFGVPHLPWQVLHTGIDIADEHGQIGDPVTPIMAGKVIDTIDSSTGLGKHVIIDHGNAITSAYGHMSAIQAVKGQEVKPGDVIGLEGSTGASTGPHVHLEVRVFGVPVNPRTFMVGDPPPGE